MTNAIFGTPNGRSGNAYCAHCGNSGNVILDVDESCAPCPMCMIGFAVNGHRKEMGGVLFWGPDGAHPSDYSWGYGSSVHHVVRCPKRMGDGVECGLPARRDLGLCDGHHAMSRQQTKGGAA